MVFHVCDQAVQGAIVTCGTVIWSSLVGQHFCLRLIHDNFSFFQSPSSVFSKKKNQNLKRLDLLLETQRTGMHLTSARLSHECQCQSRISSRQNGPFTCSSSQLSPRHRDQPTWERNFRWPGGPPERFQSVDDEELFSWYRSMYLT